MQRFISNKLEILAANLAVHLMDDTPEPMEKELLVIQNKGMESWLSMEIAKWTGISANIDFIFPQNLISSILHPEGEYLAEEDPWKTDILRWICFKELAELEDKEQNHDFIQYMGQKDTKRFQLATMMAKLFEEYMIFRPDMIKAWDMGREDHFQADLWRKVNLSIAQDNKVKLFLNAVKNPDKLKLPPRISLFAISALPPLYMDFFEFISDKTKLHCYLVDPCRKYWGDTGREEDKLDKDSEDSFYQGGAHELLLSFARVGQGFFRRLSDIKGEEMPYIEEPGRASLLSRLQSRILNLENLDFEKKDMGKDDSLILHRCHSPMREMEVLRDQLLRIFSEDKELKTGDILVIFPDIRSYAPCIEAIFSRPLSNGKKIPYTISEGYLNRKNKIADLLIRSFELMTSRFEVSRVFSLLETEEVRRKFNIEISDLELIEKWLYDTRIHWGLNAEFKEDMDLTALEENSWEFGLNRILLGMIMREEETDNTRNILAYDNMGPEDIKNLNAFLTFFELLKEFYRKSRENLSLEAWIENSWNLSQKLFYEDIENSEDFLNLRKLLNKLSKEGELAELREDISFDLFFSLLKESMEENAGRGFSPGGGISFCSMQTMRYIPFSTICLCGMNENAFPSMETRPSFDLIKEKPRALDRSSREDDRYLFLQIIISARKRLWISYTAFKQEDDEKTLPPSIVVQELFDSIEREEGKLADHIVQTHSLHPFSPVLFKEKKADIERTFSFDEDFKSISKALYFDGKEKSRLFQNEALSEEISEDTEVEPLNFKDIHLNELFFFYKNPSAFFLENILGIELEREEKNLSDREKSELNGLDKFLIRRRFCLDILKGDKLENSIKKLKAGAELPYGLPEGIFIEKLKKQALRFTDFIIKAPGLNIKEISEKSTEDEEEFSIKLEDTIIRGRIDKKEEEKWWRAGRIRAEDILRAWFYFLFTRSLNMKKNLYLLGTGREKEELISFKSDKLKKDKALLELQLLTQNYLKAHQKPLEFFPEISMFYASETLSSSTPTKEKLKSLWEGGYNSHSLASRADLLLWRDKEALNENFEKLALELLDSLYQVIE